MEADSKVSAVAQQIADALFAKELSLREVFRRWDTDCSGTLEHSELSSGLMELGVKVAPQVLSMVFESFDIKGDGHITLFELVRSLGSLQAAAEAAMDEKERQQRRAAKLDAAVRHQGQALSIQGAGLGGGHMPEVTEAQMQLADALKGDDTGNLRAALRRGAQEGFQSELLDGARKRLCELEEQNAAREGLAEAVAARPIDIPRIRAAVKDAEACGLGADETQDARKLLSAEEWRAAIRQRLRDAAAGNDEEELSDALEDGEAAGLTEEELEPSRNVLMKLQRRRLAAKALASAVLGANASELQSAIREAELSGVKESSIDEAFGFLKDLKATQVQRRLELSEDFEFTFFWTNDNYAQDWGPNCIYLQ